MTLVVRGAHRRFGSRNALRGIDVEFGAGRISAVIGPNGAGKSTLLRTLLGAERLDRGEVLLDGSPVYSLPALRRVAAMGFVAQQPTWGAAFTVREVVELGRFLLPVDRARVDAALAQLDLATLSDEIVPTLSAGQRQRVAIARALAHVAPGGWLVLDEPASALDPAHTRVLGRVLRAWSAAGGGVVATLHDLIFAAAIADDVLLLREGLAAGFGPTAALLEPDRLAALFNAPFGAAGEHVVAAPL